MKKIKKTILTLSLLGMGSLICGCSVVMTNFQGNNMLDAEEVHYESEHEYKNDIISALSNIKQDAALWGEKIEDSAFFDSEKTTEISAPEGYELVSKRINFRGNGIDGSFDPNTYSRISISEYNEIRFKTLYTANYYLWEGWNICWKDGEWVEWKLTKTGNSSWNFTGNGFRK